MSDATASGPASDDEASSMAATVGSMLHTSPADREGSGNGSDSGGSQVDSVSGTTCLMLIVIDIISSSLLSLHHFSGYT